jgi:protein-disulfide isomerase
VRTGVDAGKVKVEYRMVSFLDRASQNEYSSRAANAAMVVLDTAGVDAFWTFHDLLYSNQPAEGTAGPDDDQLVALAVQAGADENEVSDPIRAGQFDQWVVNATDQMSKNGVTGTPTVLIDGERAGETAGDSLAAVLDAVK